MVCCALSWTDILKAVKIYWMYKLTNTKSLELYCQIILVALVLRCFITNQKIAMLKVFCLLAINTTIVTMAHLVYLHYNAKMQVQVSLV